MPAAGAARRRAPGQNNPFSMCASEPKAMPGKAMMASQWAHRYPAMRPAMHPILMRYLMESLNMNISKSMSAVFLAVTLATTLGCASTATKEGTGEYVDDSVITTKVKAAIFNEPMLKSAEINVETFKGVVQLSGFVSSEADIDKAVRVARSVHGVVSVKNSMRLK